MELFKLFGTIAINNDEANQAIDETTDKAEDSGTRIPAAFSKIAGAVAAAFAIDKIVDFGKACVEVSAEVSAEQSAFEQIMGSYSDAAAEKVNKIADATGMVSTRLTPYMTSMTAKFKGLGYDVDEATDLASDGLNLAADAAAFWDKSLDDSMGALNSFINGSYEGGEAIGLFANDTQLASYAVKQGIVDETKEWANLDEAKKQATRLQYAQDMFAMSGATGQAAKEADQYANVQANLTEKWRQFKAQIGEPILQNIVLPAMDKLSGLVDTLSDGFQKLKKWVSENQTTVEILGGVIVAATSALVAYNGAMVAMAIVKSVTKWLDGMTLAQKLLNIAMSMNPIGLVVAAIGALIGVFIYLWNTSDGFREFWLGLWEKIKDAAGKVADWFERTWTKVIDWFSGAWESVKETASAVWDTIKGVWDKVSEWFTTNVIDPVVNLFAGLWESLKSIWDTICNVVEVAIMLIAEIIETAFDIITLPFRFIWENCKEYIFAAWEWIKEKVSNAINTVSNIITTVWTTVSNFFSTIWNGIKTIVGAAWDWISNKVSKVINKVKNVITTVFNAVKTVITNVWNAIKNVISKAWNDIKSVVTTAINTVKNTISKVFNAVKTTVTNIWNGIKNAISKPINAAKTTVSNVINGIKNTVSNVFNSVKSKVTDVWNGIKNAISKPINAARDTVKTAIDKMKGFFNFSWSLPKIKLPHFSISGKFSLDPPSIPKFSVNWYKRAYEGAAMFTNPTVIPTLNGYKGFGDGNGAEFVTGQQNLANTVRTAVQAETAGTAARLETLISMLADYMPQLIENSNKQIVMNNGVLVGELASGMDSRLGEINRLRGRGR